MAWLDPRRLKVEQAFQCLTQFGTLEVLRNGMPPGAPALFVDDFDDLLTVLLEVVGHVPIEACDRIEPVVNVNPLSGELCRESVVARPLWRELVLYFVNGQRAANRHQTV